MEWNPKRRQLIAEHLSNVSAGWFLLGVVTPFLTGVQFDGYIFLRIILSLISSIIILASAFILVNK